MNEAFLCFVEMVKITAPFSLAWGFGVKAYRYVVDAFTGRDARI